jgi:hypothetical protein
MTISRSKDVASAAWILALLAAVAFIRPWSLSNVALMTAIGLAGLVVLRWFWRPPAETMSQSIRNARR